MRNMVAVIGAGPAGLSASIQLSRFRIPHYIFEKSLPGGLIRNGNRIENYPGISAPVSGPDLAERLVDHFNAFGQSIIRNGVDRIEFEKHHDRFRIVSGGSVYRTGFVIASSGTEPLRPEISAEAGADLDRFIHYEIDGIRTVCGKKILMVGAGDCAFDYSLSLSGSNEIDIINRGKKIRALPLLIDRIMNIPGIHYMENTVIRKIEAGTGKDLKLGLIINGEEKTAEYDLAVFAIGRSPADEYLNGIAADDREKLVKSGRLIYAGDIINGAFRQTAIAAGDGIRSAMIINRMLNGDDNGSGI